ncbi:MAG: MFS transporter [Armatimonadetes bacterium]|nr:MFS transporter [Armatimonadota bacterium]
MKLPPALRHRAFRNYLAGSFVSNVGNMVQSAALMWHVFDITGLSAMVGLLAIARVVPLLVFSLFGGVVADRADRRKVLLLTQSCMAAVSLMLLAHSLTGSTSVVPLYLLVAVNAVARSFDGPARQALQVGLVPLKDFPNAASMNGVAWRLSDVLGPVIAGGFLMLNGKLPVSGLSLCYAFNVLSFVAVLVAVWFVPPTPPAEGEHPKNVREVFGLIKEGLRFVNATPVVRQAMWLDFWATFFSGAEAVLPAFAATVLHLGPGGYGMLAASSGVGALIAATVLTWLPTVHRQGRWVVSMIACYGFFTVCFGFSNHIVTACLSLAAVGAADMVSTVLRQTIRQLATPDELRGRMNATSSLFHISGPQLGDFEAGAVADWKGVRFSVALGGFLCLFVAANWSRAKELVGYVHEPVEHVSA